MPEQQMAGHILPLSRNNPAIQNYPGDRGRKENLVCNPVFQETIVTKSLLEGLSRSQVLLAALQVACGSYSIGVVQTFRLHH